MSQMYFAYGSNMLSERLQARCPAAQPIALATLTEHRLAFDKISLDGSGKCTCEPSSSSSVPGVIWQIDDSERPSLDQAEGLGHGYDVASIEVIDSEGKARRVFTYLATHRDASRTPYDWYWALVMAGAMQHELPDWHLERLKSQARMADPDVNRPQRLRALTALIDSGFGALL